MNLSRIWTLGALALAALCSAARGGAAEATATLRYNPTTQLRLTGPVKVRRLDSRAAPPTALEGLPTFASARPLFFELPLGPKPAVYVLALDETHGTGAGYDRLFVDANGNGDLADETALRGTTIPGDLPGAFVFLDVQVLVDYGEHQAPWHFDVYTSLVRPSEVEPERQVLAVRPRGFYEGEVTLDGERRRVAVVDADCTGRFGDPPAPSEKDSGDRVLVDLDGDGRFAPRGPEAFACTKYLKLGGAHYALSLAPSGQRLSLTPAAVPVGTLVRRGGGSFSLTLLSPEHGQVKVASQGKPVELPAGSYTLRQCTLELKTPGGPWKAAARGGAEVKPIEVAAGKTTEARFGPPLLLGVDVKVAPEGSLDKVAPGDTLVMRLQVTGQAGEVYPLGALGRGPGRPVPPTVIVRNAAGEEVARGDFRYG